MARLFKRIGSDMYWADFRDSRGRRKRVSTGCRDQVAAHQMLAKWQRAAELERSGVRLVSDEHLTSPIATHLGDWLRTRQTHGRDAAYIANARRELERMCLRFRWKTLADLTPEGIDGALHIMRTEHTAKTTNNKRGYLSALIRWCVKQRRLGENVLTTSWFERTDSRKRRALTLREVHKLLTCKEIPIWRRRVYRCMIGTGMRRAEASGLLMEHVRFDSDVPHLYLPASLTKSGEEETIPLNDEMQRVFRRAAEGRTTEQAVFAKVPRARRFEMDLIMAGIQPIDYRGRKAVLHSTRHTFASLLGASGASRLEIMHAARHRSEAETEGYLDPDLLPKQATIQRLPSLLPTVRTVSPTVPAGGASFKTCAEAQTDSTPDSGIIGRECRRQESNLCTDRIRPDEFWGECPQGVPLGAPRPFVLGDSPEAHARVIDELRQGDCAVYCRGGLFVVIDIPKDPAAVPDGATP